MKKIKLHGKYAMSAYSYALVDDNYYLWLNRYYWLAKPDAKGMTYAVADIWTPAGKKMFRMHRFIMNATPTKLVDHSDGNTINNQEHNLTLSTPSQNGANKHSSKFKGCIYDERYDLWECRIGHEKQKISLGVYDTELDCAIAYNHAARKYHGKFASYNKIEDWENITPNKHTKRHNHYQSNNKSGYPGVCYHKSSGKWQVNYNSKYIGTYPTLEEAIAARRAAEANSSD